MAAWEGPAQVMGTGAWTCPQRGHLTSLLGGDLDRNDFLHEPLGSQSRRTNGKTFSIPIASDWAKKYAAA